jgi:Methyltransferase domain
MISKDYWKHFYKSHSFDEPSQFAQFVLPRIKGNLVDLGCGDGRDLHYFARHGITCYGVDASNEDLFIIKQDVNSFIKENESIDNVYTRFFWHAIDHETQLNILKWAQKNIFIEARTTLDQPKDLFGKHQRNLVDVDQLVKDLTETGFKIDYIKQGYGMSRYFEEDPHLVRVIGHRVV